LYQSFGAYRFAEAKYKRKTQLRGYSFLIRPADGLNSLPIMVYMVYTFSGCNAIIYLIINYL